MQALSAWYVILTVSFFSPIKNNGCDWPVRLNRIPAGRKSGAIFTQPLSTGLMLRSDCDPHSCSHWGSVLPVGSPTGTSTAQPIPRNNFHTHWEWKKIVTPLSYSTVFPGRKSSEFVGSCFITTMLLYYIGRFPVPNTFWNKNEEALNNQVPEENKGHNSTHWPRQWTILLFCVFVLFIFWFSNTERKAHAFWWPPQDSQATDW